MSTVTITLSPALNEWASSQHDLSAAINSVLVDALLQQERQKTPFDLAVEKFRENLVNFPSSIEFEITQIIGIEYWTPLDRGSRLALGKYIKANSDSFGIDWIRKTSSNHAIYRKNA